VLAVIGYHVPFAFLGGGFLGVEVFFVISGYLITSLLVSEHRATGGVSLRQFWLRRARRLLPAMFVTVAITVLGASVFAPDAIAKLRGDVLAALFYVSNWWQIVDGQSYFARAGRAPLLQHLWSLAVEEQFYVLWPLAFVAMAKKLVRSSIVLTTLGVAVASALLMALWYSAVHSDPTPLYYATFTRLSGLLGGCALAMVWRPDRLHKKPGHAAVRWVMDGIAAGGFIILIVLFVAVREWSPFTYRGALPLTDIATLLIIAAVVHPNATAGKVLGHPVLVAIGKRSYGLYLWHFPIFQITRPDIDIHMHWFVVLLIRAVLTIGLSEACFRWVETPIRHGAIGRWWHNRSLFRPEYGRWKRRGVIAAASVVPLLVAGILIFDNAESGAKKLERETASATQAALDAPLLTTAATSAPPAAASPSTTVGAVAPTTVAPPPPPAAAAIPGLAPVADPQPTVPPPPGLPPSLTALTLIGDSVMKGAAPVLQKNIPNVGVYAETSRQFGELPGIIDDLAARSLLAPVVVIHLGTNGTITDQLVNLTMQKLGPSRQVYFITPKVPRSWEAEDVARLESIPPHFSNARIIDWHNAAKDNPALFVSDGTHLTKEGILAYTQLILNALN
jgi:peptidoglycan/LPS O-acetylase OafA/YrhL